jgi:hypothetical protein
VAATAARRLPLTAAELRGAVGGCVGAAMARTR